MMQISFDRNIDLGGKALLSNAICREFPELKDLQQQFHQQDRRWWNLLTPQQRQATELLSFVSASASNSAVKIFVSYAQVPQDEILRSKLAIPLKPMEREGLITVWYAGNISAGQEQKEEAKKHLEAAQIILLLVSPDFLSSDYHYDFEMKLALKRHHAKTARIIPIILRNTAGWEMNEFSKLQALPRDGKPVKPRSDLDKVLAEIAKDIRDVVEQLKGH